MRYSLVPCYCHAPGAAGTAIFRIHDRNHISICFGQINFPFEGTPEIPDGIKDADDLVYSIVGVVPEGDDSV